MSTAMANVIIRLAEQIEKVEAACDEAEEDLSTGADHYDEPVVTVAALREILKMRS